MVNWGHKVCTVQCNKAKTRSTITNVNNASANIKNLKKKIDECRHENSVLQIADNKRHHHVVKMNSYTKQDLIDEKKYTHDCSV